MTQQERAVTAVFLLVNADRPTLAEYEAARNAGYIDVTPAGMQALKDWDNILAAAREVAQAQE
jgi:hypothetical protein